MYQNEFHVPGPGPYALTHSVGCLPKRSAAAIEASYLQPWRVQGGDAWPQWLSAIDEFRESLAMLLGGDAVDYCPQSNLSSGLAKLLPALPRRAGRTLLLAAEDCFPSMAFVLQRAQELGYDTRLIPRAQDPSSMATWRDALTSEVAAVLVTHAHSNTGIVAPVAGIAALCRERGIVCMIDVAQSAGILPFSVTEVGRTSFSAAASSGSAEVRARASCG
jgi:kynureninase